jgi:hypothetical protein
MSNKKEIWKSFTIDGKKPSVPYMISNRGRFGVMNNGKIEVRNFKPTSGIYRFNTRQHGKNKAIFLYKEVANAFLKKPSPKHKFVIHKDHNYLNDDVSNLKWATREEHRAHTTFSPRAVMARRRKAITSSTHAKVLNENTVRALKKMIWDPKRKLSYKKLAEKFGVSEMQIYRIKTGEFWYHIHVENEPLHQRYKQNLQNIALREKSTKGSARPAKKSATKKKPRNSTSASRRKK